MEKHHHSSSSGTIFVVGIGPGDKKYRTIQAENILKECEAIVGYPKYLELVQDHLKNKQVFSSGMGKEILRAKKTLELAEKGLKVALVSSGDAGIYGMAGLIFELMHKEQSFLPVEVIPGVSAGQYLAAKVGAPLMLDFACLSLSDLLVPWETIAQRLLRVAQADLVTILYNPKSKKRNWQLNEAREIFLKHRKPNTWVAVGKNLSLASEQIFLTTLKDLDLELIDMRTTLIIGNSTTQKLGKFLVSLRGYAPKML